MSYPYSAVETQQKGTQPGTAPACSVPPSLEVVEDPYTHTPDYSPHSHYYTHYTHTHARQTSRSSQGPSHSPHSSVGGVTPAVGGTKEALDQARVGRPEVALGTGILFLVGYIAVVGGGATTRSAAPSPSPYPASTSDYATAIPATAVGEEEGRVEHQTERRVRGPVGVDWAVGGRNTPTHSGWVTARAIDRL